MRLSKQGIRFIAAREGFRPRAYICPAGVLTIGYGFTNRSGAFVQHWKAKYGRPLQKGDTINQDEALELLGRIGDAEYGSAVVRFFGTGLPQHHYDAATSMVFNCGARSLNWNWAKALEVGDIERSARHLRKTGVTVKGKRLKGLVKRRAMEAEILLNANYGSGGISSTRMPEGRRETVTQGALLKRGVSGESVRDLQVKLKKAGYAPGTVDGVYGALTVQAVLAFQEAKGLKLDGMVRIGGETWAALDAALAKGERRDLGARAKATRRDLPQSRTMAAANKGGGLITLAGLAGAAGLGGDTLGIQGVEQVTHWLSNIGAFGLDWLHCGLIGGSGYLYWQLRQTGKARLDDHKKGKTL